MNNKLDAKLTRLQNAKPFIDQVFAFFQCKQLPDADRLSYSKQRLRLSYIGMTVLWYPLTYRCEITEGNAPTRTRILTPKQMENLLKQGRKGFQNA